MGGKEGWIDGIQRSLGVKYEFIHFIQKPQNAHQTEYPMGSWWQWCVDTASLIIANIPPWGDIDSREGHVYMGKEVCGKSLYLLLNFAVNINSEVYFFKYTTYTDRVT